MAKRPADSDFASATKVESPSLIRLIEDERRYRDFAEASADWFWETAPDGRLTYLSARFEELTGLSPRDVLGAPMEDVFEPWGASAETLAAHAAALAGGAPFRDWVVWAPGGVPRVFRLAGRPVRLRAGGPALGYRGNASDVTSELRARAEMERLAHHDALTGLPNRALFLLRLEATLRGRRSDDQGFAIALMDLDGFKAVNDTLGHAAGDAVLRQVAERLSGEIRATDTLARLGGDEFALLLPGVCRGEDAAALAERLIARVDEPFRVDGRPARVGLSLGVALAPQDGTDGDRLLRGTDDALYRAKRAGRRTWRRHEGARGAAEAGLAADLEQAIAQGAVGLAWLPVVSLGNRRVVAAEGLLRWTHPAHGAVPAGEIVRIAEERRLMPMLGEAMLDRALAFARASGLAVALNLSPEQVLDARLAASTAAALERAGLPADQLTFDIKETALIQQPERAEQRLAGLKALGVRLALDDYGTGVSPLAVLSRYAFDEIKADRPLVAQLGRSLDSTAMLRALLDLGRRFGVRVIAEGVETEGQAGLARDLGFTHAQGFLFGEPMPQLDFLRRHATPGVHAAARSSARPASSAAC
jgi:diguanylate cyclase (GGDEF)-like protein/PAS domain S-box-containing protein